MPPQVTIRAGGEMTRHVRKTVPGIVPIPDLASTVNALDGWRSPWVRRVAGDWPAEPVPLAPARRAASPLGGGQQA